MLCIIGAGPSGITAAKNAKQAGIPYILYEKSGKVGGNWVFNDATGHSSVYENTHIISSKTLSSYEDFPMPDHYPDYPNHRLVQAYFEDYARHFGVLNDIQFHHTVTHAQLNEAGHWMVTVMDADGNASTSDFSHLMVANGHHWNPSHPSISGNYTGNYMHSHDFKRVDDSWRGQRVLVIGAGNSAADVAVEASRIAECVHMSMRSAQWFTPKYMFGTPADVLATRSRWMPRRLRQWSLTLLLKIMQGFYKDMGLPENTKPVLSHHPTVNSDLLDIIRHGRIIPKPGIDSWEGKKVMFTDGRQEEYDIIVAATGFKISFPFFDKQFIYFEDAEKVPLYRKMMHADIPNLYFIGLFQPLGCIWPLADHQAKIACKEILGQYNRPNDIKTRIDHEIANPHYKFEGGSRHSTEVDYHMFRSELLKEL